MPSRYCHTVEPMAPTNLNQLVCCLLSHTLRRDSTCTIHLKRPEIPRIQTAAADSLEKHKHLQSRLYHHSTANYQSLGTTRDCDWSSNKPKITQLSSPSLDRRPQPVNHLYKLCTYYVMYVLLASEPRHEPGRAEPQPGSVKA